MTVLGFVSEGAPCTAYWIRREFQKSPSTFFSGSAGAVYPAVERLEKSGLVEGTAGPRGSTHYELTEEGLEALRSWLLRPVPAEEMAYTYDPVRTRLFYLAPLTPTERVEFVTSAIAQAESHRRIVEADVEVQRAGGNELYHLGALGVLRQAEARVAWLREVLEVFERHLAEESG